jgi:hypothetical protein
MSSESIARDGKYLGSPAFAVPNESIARDAKASFESLQQVVFLQGLLQECEKTF